MNLENAGNFKNSPWNFWNFLTNFLTIYFIEKFNVQGSVIVIIVIIKTWTAIFLFKSKIYSTEMCSLYFGWKNEYSQHISMKSFMIWTKKLLSKFSNWWGILPPKVIFIQLFPQSLLLFSYIYIMDNWLALNRMEFLLKLFVSNSIKMFDMISEAPW